jgi:hypothetical protein
VAELKLLVRTILNASRGARLTTRRCPVEPFSPSLNPNVFSSNSQASGSCGEAVRRRTCGEEESVIVGGEDKATTLSA